MSILIVEDDKNIADLIKRRLEAEHYKVAVAYDGEKGFKKALNKSISLIILDVMLSKKDGLSIIRDLRRAKISTPVLILSAKNSVEDIVAGLDAGADAYLRKPFDQAELLARIRALLRRSKQGRGSEICFANLRLDPITRKAWCKEKEIHLTSKEYALLEFFIRNPNQVLSRSAIVENVWPNMQSVKFTNIVSVYASFLRKKIDKVTGRTLIHTVSRTGYILKET